MQAISNIHQAAQLLSDYGNISQDAAQLLSIKPTPSQLRQARLMAQQNVDGAITIIANHFNIIDEKTLNYIFGSM